MSTVPLADAKAQFAKDPDLTSLAAAVIGLAHIEHHGKALKFTGSTYLAWYTKHRFACQEPGCTVKMVWEVTEDCGHPIDDVRADGPFLTCGRCGAELDG